MNIRIMVPEDYDEAMAIWLESDGVGRSPDDTREYITSYISRNPNTSFVAEENGRMIGAIMAGHDGYRGFIHHTAVAEKYRGKGIGTLLVEKVVEAIRNEGINKLMFVTLTSNKKGNEFWEKQGFYIRDDLYYRDKRIK